MIFARTFYTLLGTLLLAGAILLAFQATGSESGDLLVDIVFGLPIVCLLAGFSFHATARAIRNRLLPRRRAALIYASSPLAAFVAYHITLSSLVPSTIRYRFGYPGASGTYHRVQFYFKHDGQWLEGPSVEGWPLTVRFPDLNKDGYPDIRVIDDIHGGAVEFVYLPQNDGHIFWRALNNKSGLLAAYPPAHYFSHYP